MKLAYVQLGGRYNSALSAAELQMLFVRCSQRPIEKHGALDAMLAQMVREKKGKMTAGMRALIKKAIRA